MLKVFQNHHWPGNLRELRNVIKRAVLLSTGEYIEVDALPKDVLAESPAESIFENGFSKADYEKDQIIKALKKTNFNKSKAAKTMGISREALRKKLIQSQLVIDGLAGSVSFSTSASPQSFSRL